LYRQEKLEALYKNMEIAVRAFDQYTLKELKGEDKRAIRHQFEAFIDIGELSYLGTLVYNLPKKRKGLF
jgi:hypothetical protein